MRKTDRAERVAVFIFGVIFVIAILALSIFFPDPSDFQYTVFRIVLALAAAGVTAFMPGFLNFEIRTWLRAGGAMAVFVIVFFYSPAQLIHRPDVPEKGDEVRFSTESLDTNGAVLNNSSRNSKAESGASIDRYSLKFTLWNRSPYERMRISSVRHVVIASANQIHFCCPETRSFFNIDIALSGLRYRQGAWPVTIEIPSLASHAFDADVRLIPGDPDHRPLVWMGLLANYSGPDGQQRTAKSDKVYLLNADLRRLNGSYDLAALRRLIRADPDFARWANVEQVIAWFNETPPRP